MKRSKKKKKIILWINGVLVCCVVVLSILLIQKQGKEQDHSAAVITTAEQDTTLSSVSGTAPTKVETTTDSKKEEDQETTKETSKTETTAPEATLPMTTVPEATVPVTTDATEPPQPLTTKKEADYADYASKKEAWCFQRKEDHVPSGTYEPFDISPYNAYFLNKNVKEEDKVIYLAFDCGYEYGFTPKILDVLKKHDVKGTFFVTKDFLKTSLDLAIRMKEEGHMVGNHSVTHPSFPTKNVEQIQQEILGCQEYFEEKTGYTMDRFIRPPMGEYSERSLKVTQDLGYTSIFWSMAYFDYDVKDQPGKDYVVDHFNKYYHNGAITLIHTISESNTEALEEVISNLKKEGYRFGSLDELN